MQRLHALWQREFRPVIEFDFSFTSTKPLSGIVDA
jgi:hypothetical protein